MDHRSPLESIFGMIGALPQGHDKPVKHALYNAVALLLLFVCCAAAWGLFLVLEPFVKPLIWALLVGSVLHPLKRSLRERFHAWFEHLEISNTPILIGVTLLPINIIDNLSEFIGNLLVKWFKIIVIVCATVPTILLMYNYTPSVVCVLIGNTWTVIFTVLNFLINNTSLALVAIVLIGYLSLTFVAWKPENNVKFHYASTGIWVLLALYLSSCFGSFQMPVFIALLLVFFGGFVAEVYDIYIVLNNEGNQISLLEALLLAFHDKSCDLDVSETSDESKDGNETKEKTIEKENPPEVEVEAPKTVKFVEAAGDNSISELASKKDDPWNLELYESKAEPHISNAGVLITHQGIQIIKPTAKKRELKRSLSQPQFFQNSPRLNFLRHRKLSINRSTSREELKYESTFYLYSIVWACIGMLFWRHIILLPLLPVPILFYSIKHTGQYFGFWSYINSHINCVYETVKNWCFERHDALVPVPIRGLYRALHRINVIIKSSVRESLDTVASCVVIFGLIIFMTCASVFIVFQIYTETIMMVQMTGNVINQTVVHNPGLRQLLPPNFDETVDSVLDNAYVYSREGISKALKSVMTNVDPVKAEKLEHQVLELWDRVYQSWMTTDDSNGPKVTSDAVRISWENFLHDLQKSPEMLNVNGIVNFAKQNVGTLMSLLESIWGIFKGNIQIFVGSFSTLLSVILDGGTAVINFIVNAVVFLTTLFYLLNSSGELYKPVQLLTNLSTGGRRFGQALEGAVNGVFAASIKMAVFYGLWTWFIHNLFGLKIVYLPTAFATIFGAAPFLGTYWACLPAVLDLWLAQDRGIAAILFAICQFLPTSIVDTTIYSEIKGGGHPYLTGLAIGGGIFCLGLEGAIFGPLLLCGLYVAINLSSNLFKESPSDESINLGYRLDEQ